MEQTGRGQTAEEHKSAAAMRRRLSGIIAAWRAVEAGRGVCISLCVFLLPVILGTLLGTAGYLRCSIVILSLIAGVVSSIYFIIFPLFKRINILDAAFLVERTHTKLKGLLAAAVELSGDDGKSAAYVNEEMLSGLMKETETIFSEVRIFNVVSLIPFFRAVAAAASFLIVFSIVFSLAHIQSSALTAFIIPPYLPERESFKIVSMTGDTTVPTGGAAEIKIVCEGNYYGSPHLLLEKEGLEPYIKPLEKIAGAPGKERTYRAKITSITGDMIFRAEYKDFKSPEHRISAVEPPRIKSMTLSLVYPRHTGLLPDKREGGDLRVPAGTRVAFSVDASSPLKGAFVIIDGAKKMPLSVDGESASGALTVLRNVRYSIGLVDSHGFPNRFPPEYSIEAVPDRSPEITLIKPEKDITAPRDSIIKIKGGANDDYGISSIRLLAKIIGTEKSYVYKISVQPGREALFEYPWNLDGIEAFEGDTVEFRLSATDNDSLTGPKTSFSASRKIHLLSRYEDYKDIREEQREIISKMESTLREGKNINDKFRDLAQNLDTSPKGRRQWRSDAERTLERQQNLEKEVGDLSKSLQDSVERMEKNEYVNLESISKIQEINRLMKDIMTDDMKKLIEQIKKNIEQTDLTNVDQSLLDKVQSQEKIMQSLDQTLQRMKKIRAEQELEALRRHIKGLAEREEKLLAASKTLSQSAKGDKLKDKQISEAARQAREQAAIKDEAESALDSAERLSDSIKSLDQDTASKMKKMAEAAKKQNMSESMSDAEKHLRGGKPSKALPDETASLEALKQMSEGMDGIASKYDKQMKAEVAKLIGSLLRRTLDISNAHDKSLKTTQRLIQHDSTTIPKSKLKEIVSDEQLSQDTAENLARDAWRLATLSMVVPPYVSTLASDTSQELKNTIDFLSANSTSQAVASQRSAAGLLNKLSLALFDAQRNAAMASPMSALDELMNQLQKMAQSQEALNEMTRSLGNSGMPIPGMGDAMKSLALQQKLIGDGMQKLADEMGRMGEIGERLHQIEKEMQAIQKNLADGKADSDVQRRQANVLRRLQDASLSLRKESLDQNRVAETAKKYDAEPPQKTKDLLKEALPENVIEELDKMRKQPRPQGYERLIEKYYNELMRGEQ